MRYENNDRLREYLHRGASGAHREFGKANAYPRFEFSDEAFAAALDQVCAQFPDLTLEDAEARAAFRLLTSAVAPEVATPLPSPWYRTKTLVHEACTQNWPWLKLAWAVAVLALCATAVALLSALVVRAEPTPQHMQAYRNAVRGLSLLSPSPAGLAAQQPGGIIFQFQQGGSVLATRPAGLIALNCATGMSCSFSGTTFTLTSTGAGGSGCTPPGTPSRFLYDDGAGGCLDSGLTWTSGSSTATAPNGVTLTYSGTGIINARQVNGTEFTNMESLGKIPIGQGDGTAVWADPLVQGLTAHDAVGTSTNPVLIGGYASAAAPTDVSADGDAVRGWFLRNGAQVFNLRASNGTEIFTAGAPGNVNTQAINGSTAATGNGTTTAGTQRVTISSDSTGQVAIASLPNEGQQTMANSISVAVASDQSPVPVSAASLPLPTGAATESTLSTLNGKVTAVDTGNVTIAALPNEGQQTMANSLSVAIASNQSAVPVSQSGTWSLAANQSVNLAQIAGNTTLTGNGTTGAGAQRVTLSSDNSAIANWGHGATGSAVPAGAQQIAGVGTGNLTAPLACDSYAFYDASTNGATQLVALTSSQTIFVCGYSFSSSSTTANTVKLVYGTGTNCGTGQTAMTPGTVLQAATSTGPVGKVIPVSGWSRGLRTAASNALCVLTNAAAAAQVEVWYTKF